MQNEATPALHFCLNDLSIHIREWTLDIIYRLVPTRDASELSLPFDAALSDDLLESKPCWEFRVAVVLRRTKRIRGTHFATVAGGRSPDTSPRECPTCSFDESNDSTAVDSQTPLQCIEKRRRIGFVALFHQPHQTTSQSWRSSIARCSAIV